MKSVTQFTIFLGCIISLLPAESVDGGLGILLSIFGFGLSIVLSNLAFEGEGK